MKQTLHISATLVALAFLATDATPNAFAGGLMRPNPVSARSVGMGGAFAAVADDATALHFNPAGLALLTRSHIMFGAEFIVAPRTYKPIFANDAVCNQDPVPAQCQEQSPTSPVRPLPSIGFATRLKKDGVPSRLGFGVGFWNTFGGQLDYSTDDPEIPGTLKATRNAVLELVPGIAYQVNDVLAIGGAFRLGIGLFDSEAVARPSNAELTARGVGVGATLGVMVTPGDKVRIGVYYRTAMTVTTNGDGDLFLAGPDETPTAIDVEFKQQWPEQAGLGVALMPSDALTLSGQIDWHGWGRINSIRPVYSGGCGAGCTSLVNQAEIPTDWDDNWQFHIGANYDLGRVELRGGFTFDTLAIPDRYRERQFLDGDSMFFALGGSFNITSSWRIDSAFELGPGGTYTIEDNSAAVMDWTCPIGRPSCEQANNSPGEHSGKLYTFELAVQYLY